MDKKIKIVTSIPLLKLWTDDAELVVERGEYLTTYHIGNLLTHSPVTFVIADIGLRLRWIDPKDCYDFWKTEVQQHLANDMDTIYLDVFPDGYVYIASEWRGEYSTPIILLEKQH
jgi:hypothetical protein